MRSSLILSSIYIALATAKPISYTSSNTFAPRHLFSDVKITARSANPWQDPKAAEKHAKAEEESSRSAAEETEEDAEENARIEREVEEEVSQLLARLPRLGLLSYPEPDAGKKINKRQGSNGLEKRINQAARGLNHGEDDSGSHHGDTVTRPSVSEEGKRKLKRGDEAMSRRGNFEEEGKSTRDDHQTSAVKGDKGASKSEEADTDPVVTVKDTYGDHLDKRKVKRGVESLGRKSESEEEEGKTSGKNKEQTPISTSKVREDGKTDSEEDRTGPFYVRKPAERWGGMEKSTWDAMTRPEVQNSWLTIGLDKNKKKAKKWKWKWKGWFSKGKSSGNKKENKRELKSTGNGEKFHKEDDWWGLPGESSSKRRLQERRVRRADEVWDYLNHEVGPHGIPFGDWLRGREPETQPQTVLAEEISRDDDSIWDGSGTDSEGDEKRKRMVRRMDNDGEEDRVRVAQEAFTAWEKAYAAMNVNEWSMAQQAFAVWQKAYAAMSFDERLAVQEQYRKIEKHGRPIWRGGFSGSEEQRQRKRPRKDEEKGKPPPSTKRRVRRMDIDGEEDHERLAREAFAAWEKAYAAMDIDGIIAGLEQREKNNRPPASKGSSDFKPPASKGGSSSKPPASKGSSDFKPPAEKGSSSFKPPASKGSSDSKPPASKGSSDSRPPAEKESSQSRRPSEKESSHSKRPSEKESSHSRRPSEKESSHSKRPSEKESSHSRPPSRELSPYSRPPDWEGSAYSRRPSWRENSYSRRPSREFSPYSRPPNWGGSAYSRRPSWRESPYARPPSREESPYSRHPAWGGSAYSRRPSWRESPYARPPSRELSPYSRPPDLEGSAYSRRPSWRESSSVDKGKERKSKKDEDKGKERKPGKDGDKGKERKPKKDEDKGKPPSTKRRVRRMDDDGEEDHARLAREAFIAWEKAYAAMNIDAIIAAREQEERNNRRPVRKGSSSEDKGKEKKPDKDEDKGKPPPSTKRRVRRMDDDGEEDHARLAREAYIAWERANPHLNIDSIIPPREQEEGPHRLQLRKGSSFEDERTENNPKKDGDKGKPRPSTERRGRRIENGDDPARSARKAFAVWERAYNKNKLHEWLAAQKQRNPARKGRSSGSEDKGKRKRKKLSAHEELAAWEKAYDNNKLEDWLVAQKKHEMTRKKGNSILKRRSFESKDKGQGKGESSTKRRIRRMEDHDAVFAALPHERRLAALQHPKDKEINKGKDKEEPSASKSKDKGESKQGRIRKRVDPFGLRERWRNEQRRMRQSHRDFTDSEGTDSEDTNTDEEFWHSGRNWSTSSRPGTELEKDDDEIWVGTSSGSESESKGKGKCSPKSQAQGKCSPKSMDKGKGKSFSETKDKGESSYKSGDKRKAFPKSKDEGESSSKQRKIQKRVDPQRLESEMREMREALQRAWNLAHPVDTDDDDDEPQTQDTRERSGTEIARDKDPIWDGTESEEEEEGKCSPKSQAQEKCSPKSKDKDKGESSSETEDKGESSSETKNKGESSYLSRRNPVARSELPGRPDKNKQGKVEKRTDDSQSSSEKASLAARSALPQGPVDSSPSRPDPVKDAERRKQIQEEEEAQGGPLTQFHKQLDAWKKAYKKHVQSLSELFHPSEGAGGKSEEAGGKGEKTGVKSEEAGGKGEKTGGKGEETGVKSEEAGGKGEKTGVKSEEAGVKSEEAGGKGGKTGVKSEEAGGKYEEAGGKGEKTGVKSEEAGGKYEEVKVEKRTDEPESEKKSEKKSGKESQNKRESKGEAHNESHGSGLRIHHDPDQHGLGDEEEHDVWMLLQAYQPWEAIEDRDNDDVDDD